MVQSVYDQFDGHANLPFKYIYVVLDTYFSNCVECICEW